MKLDRWIHYGNCLVGYVYDAQGFPPGTRIQTEAVRFIDPVNFVAECLDGKYKLCDPGTVEEHQQPLLGQNKVAAETPTIDTSMFLNPNG